jgi:hypothetical protein
VLLFHPKTAGTDHSASDPSRQLLCPAHFHWQPWEGDKNGAKASDGSGMAASSLDRRLWLWVHAAVYDMLCTALCELADEFNVKVNSTLRYDLLRYELTGVQCTAVLTAALRAHGSKIVPDKSSTSKRECIANENALTLLPLLKQCRAGMPLPLPYGLCVALTAQDPRTVTGVKQAFAVDSKSDLTSPGERRTLKQKGKVAGSKRRRRNEEERKEGSGRKEEGNAQVGLRTFVASFSGM